MKQYWKYSDSGKAAVKHVFYSSTQGTALCGQCIPWYSKCSWHDDEEGLEERRECRSCIYMMKVNDRTATPADHHGVARKTQLPDPEKDPEPRSPRSDNLGQA